MTDNDPWAGLKIPETNDEFFLRYSLDNNPFELYRGLDVLGRRMFFLIHDTKNLTTNKFPKMNGLIINQTIRNDNKGMLSVTLDNQNYIEVFTIFCEDIIDTISKEVTEIAAVQAFIGRAMKWHAFLRRANTQKLSYEAQLGLIGELYTLNENVSNITTLANAIHSWKGPEKTPKDFEFSNLCIECKSRGASSKDTVRISSEYQLAEVENAELVLMVHTFGLADETQKINKIDLHSIVSKINNRIASECPDISDLFEEKILESGYNKEHDYEVIVTHQSTEVFLVKEEFPRIIPGTYSSELSQISYDLLLSSIDNFKISYSEFVNKISGEN